MSTQVPIIRQSSLKAFILQLIALLAAIALGVSLDQESGLIWGVLGYLAYSTISRNLIPAAHRSGMKLVRQKRWNEAIPYFEKSLDFFERNSWIDKYRSIVLMSSSALSYTEMAMCNLAFCYSQSGDGINARKFYQLCLERFPNCGLAQAGLRMMDAASSTKQM